VRLHPYLTDVFFFSSRRRHTRWPRDWSSDVCSSDLGVRQGALQGEFTTRNTLDPDRSILMQLVSGPFRTLQGEWRLTPVDGDGCRVELAMRFAFRNPLTAMLFEPRFAETLGSLVDAFVARARSRP